MEAIAKQTHTPRPWEVGRGHEGATEVCIPACGCVARKTIAFVESRTHAVDAHLIAAAPEMLAALRGVVDHGEFNQQLLNEARAAIAKAEGGGS